MLVLALLLLLLLLRQGVEDFLQEFERFFLFGQGVCCGIGTAAAGHVPKPLLEQLKPGGRMILPEGSPWGDQYLILITKDKKGKLHRENVMPVRFVPMTGEVQKPKRGSKR